MPIIEQRIFSGSGKLTRQTFAPDITDLREYRDELRPHLVKTRVKRYDSRRGVFFELDDWKMIVVILGTKAEALAGTSAPVVTQHIAAD
jgi:hypothetical protein